MSETHFVIVGSCGHVISQCRCMDADKLERRLPEPCPTCKQQRDLAQSLGTAEPAR